MPVPNAPTNLTGSAVVPVTSSYANVDLTWTDNSTNETNMQVLRSSSIGYRGIALLGANITSYRDTGSLAGTTTNYMVRAKNASGFSLFSNIMSVVIPPTETIPAAPSNLALATSYITGSGSGSYTQVTATWTDNSTNEASFVLKRKVGTGSFVTIATPAQNATSHVDNWYGGSAFLSYQVFATNVMGTSSGSNVATASVS